MIVGEKISKGLTIYNLECKPHHLFCALAVIAFLALIISNISFLASGSALTVAQNGFMYGCLGVWAGCTLIGGILKACAMKKMEMEKK